MIWKANSYRLRQFSKLLVIVGFLYTGIGCVGTKYLKEGEYLLYNQKINTSQSQLKENLQKQMVLKRNSRIWILPIATYTYVYYQGLKSYDTARYNRKKSKIIEKFATKIANKGISNNKKGRLQKRSDKKVSKQNNKLDNGNLLMRWGEPLVIYDSSAIGQSTRNMKTFMESNGWFLANVDYKTTLKNKRAKVEYFIQEGPRYRLDSILYNISDTSISRLITENLQLSKLTVSNPYKQEDLSSERERIEALLKNNGYFDFSRQYIRFRVDSTIGNHKVIVQLSVLQPKNGDHHRSFTLDSVNFWVDVNNLPKKSMNKSITYKNIRYNFYNEYYSEKVLGRRIHLEPGDKYSRLNTLKTQRELAAMDMFKFVNINYDTTRNSFLANIFVSPLHHYQWSAEAGLTVTQSLPGPFASISLKQRNIFSTLGILELSGNIGVEGVAAASNPNDVLASLEAGANVTLTFPKFFLPISDETKVKLGFYNPKSTISGGVSFTDRPEYTRSNLIFYNSYTWQPTLNILYDFKLLEIGLIRTIHLDPEYLQRLEDLEQNGNNLINSFKPSFISNQRFVRSVNNNNYGKSFSNSSYSSITIEPGGTFTNLWARDYFARDSLEIYAYLKVDGDYRRAYNLGKKKSWAFRVRAGVAYPYGENGLLPYEKYFFSGGSISNRAWKPRRLGPGSYNHLDESGNVSYKFEQQGEIILESNIEYRQQLIGFLQWAAFVDIGNIWMIREDPSRPGAQFKWNRFYQELAAGAGLGLRFDFTFFIMRFDVGTKVYDPARPVGKRFILNPGFNDAPFNNKSLTEPVIYTLSIGYPF